MASQFSSSIFALLRSVILPAASLLSNELHGALWQKTPPPPSSNQPPQAKEYRSRLEIGADYTHVNLKPHGNPGFRGNLGGAQGIYEYRPANRFYGAALVSWKEGDTHGAAGKRWLIFVDGQERMGYTFGFKQDRWLLTLYSGLGIRHVGQKLKPKDSSSIWFNYNEFYFPLGFITNYSFGSWFALGIGFAWMPQAFPTVTIRPIDGARWKLTNTLNNYHVEIPFDFTLTKNKRLHLVLKPFYEYWNDGHTTAKTTTGVPLGLPGNTYNYCGADLNLGYCF
jgi:hypothetical protein